MWFDKFSIRITRFTCQSLVSHFLIIARQIRNFKIIIAYIATQFAKKKKIAIMSNYDHYNQIVFIWRFYRCICWANIAIKNVDKAKLYFFVIFWKIYIDYKKLFIFILLYLKYCCFEIRIEIFHEYDYRCKYCTL